MSVAVEEVPLGEPKWLEYALYEATEAKDAPPHDAHNVVILRVETGGIYYLHIGEKYYLNFWGKIS